MRKIKLHPITARYDAYLIITVSVVFVISVIIGLARHRMNLEFVGVCGAIIVLAVSFLLVSRR